MKGMDWIIIAYLGYAALWGIAKLHERRCRLRGDFDSWRRPWFEKDKRNEEETQ